MLITSFQYMLLHTSQREDIGKKLNAMSSKVVSATNALDTSNSTIKRLQNELEMKKLEDLNFEKTQVCSVESPPR